MEKTTHNTEILPPHARLVADADVWIEGAAVDQLARIARLPGCSRAVGLPDLHPGPGVPIGAAFAFRDVRPALVGGDAGCGVRLVALPRCRFKGDDLERRVREATDGPPLPDVDPGEALAATWALGPRGLAEVAGVPDDLVELAAAEPDEGGPFAALTSGPTPDADFGRSLGTVGGGNHFMEVTAIERVLDRGAAREGGLKRGGVAVLAHSGSRGLGKDLARRWGAVALRGDDQIPYLRELAGALRFARANRLVLCWRMLRALGAARPGRISGSLDLVHNGVAPGPGGDWVHLKGAAPAPAGELTVVLGTRGSPSWVMVGAGREETLGAVSHGAGRRMTKAEAEAKIKHRYRRASLRRTATGGRVICEDTRLLYSQHPAAYKAIEPVIASLEGAGAARRVASLRPLITVKR